MTTRSLVALLAFALVGCAPFAAGSWQTPGSSLALGGYSVERLEIAFEGNQSATVRVVNGGLSACPQRYSHTASGRWFVNAAGETILDVSCTHDVPSCDTSGGVMRSFDLCGTVRFTRGRFVQQSDALASLETPSVVLVRSR